MGEVKLHEEGMGCEAQAGRQETQVADCPSERRYRPSSGYGRGGKQMDLRAAGMSPKSAGWPG